MFGAVKLACLLNPFPASPSNTLVTSQEKSILVDLAERSSVNLNNEYEANQPEAHTTNYDLEVQNGVMGHGCHDMHVKCHCGKKCKGFRSPRAHRRFCDISFNPDLNLLFFEDPISLPSSAQFDNDESADNTECLDQNDLPQKKIGIKLHKTSAEWYNANEYFKSRLNLRMNYRILMPKYTCYKTKFINILSQLSDHAAMIWKTEIVGRNFNANITIVLAATHILSKRTKEISLR